MSTPPAFRTWPRGFTLIEIVMVMVLLGVLGIATSKIISASVYTNQTISNTNMAYASARYALERMDREIREMQNSGSLQIVTPFQAQTLTFTKSGPQGQTTVTFSFANGALSMAYNNGTPHVLANKLSSMAFSYYQDVGAASATASASASTLHYVFIRMQVQPDPALNQVFTLSNLVYLHNS